MTYCVGILLKDGLVFASDSRTHAGVDNFAKFCKMTVFERVGDRVLILLSSGNLAGTQAVINVLKQRSEVTDGPPNLWTACTMFDVVVLVSDAMRDSVVTRPSWKVVPFRSTPLSSSGDNSKGSGRGCFASMPRATSSKRETIHRFYKLAKRSTENRSLIGSSCPRPRSRMPPNAFSFPSIRPCAAICL